ncbi:MAG: MetS family NSS transporter small subunit [Candidatus Krumholzibacteriota bacterium]|nr:MetS family NSS transporter small subunit [Candidatus Krumholzibacteriota bacterium]
MTGPALAMMILFFCLVWGGFIGLIIFIMRVEKRKSR